MLREAQEPDEARVPVVEGGHGVVEVRQQRRARADARDALGLRRLAVAEAHGDAAFREVGDGVGRAGQLGGERDDDDAVEGPVALGHLADGARRRDVLREVRALLRLVEERALEVEP